MIFSMDSMGIGKKSGLRIFWWTAVLENPTPTKWASDSSVDGMLYVSVCRISGHS